MSGLFDRLGLRGYSNKAKVQILATSVVLYAAVVFVVVVLPIHLLRLGMSYLGITGLLAGVIRMVALGALFHWAVPRAVDGLMSLYDARKEYVENLDTDEKD